STKVNPDQNTLRVAQTAHARHANAKRNQKKQGYAARRASPSCASRRHQKVKLPLHQYPASRASPSCAPRQRQKVKPPQYTTRRAAQHHAARSAGIRKFLSTWIFEWNSAQ
ncbi:hypothetical protein A2U01_0061036, partial [Trifolium medium]|nr:hypothetical protein [Trifolium medium]